MAEVEGGLEADIYALHAQITKLQEEDRTIPACASTEKARTTKKYPNSWQHDVFGFPYRIRRYCLAVVSLRTLAAHSNASWGAFLDRAGSQLLDIEIILLAFPFQNGDTFSKTMPSTFGIGTHDASDSPLELDLRDVSLQRLSHLIMVVSKHEPRRHFESLLEDLVLSSRVQGQDIIVRCVQAPSLGKVQVLGLETWQRPYISINFSNLA